MSRTNKGTRAKGLPPKIQLQIQDCATGSIPSHHRTPSDNRTGQYRTYFDDTKTMAFGSEIKKVEGFNVTRNYSSVNYLAGGDVKIWWNMEHTSSTNKLKDESIYLTTNRHPLTLFSGAITSSDVPSQYASGEIYSNNRSLSFQSTLFQYASDDSSAYLSEHDRASAQSWAMACHVKFDALAYAYNPIMWRGNYTGSLADYEVMVDNAGYLYAGVFDSVAVNHKVYKTTNSVINVGQWQHVAVSFNAGAFTFYVDGTAVAAGVNSDTGWVAMVSANNPMFLALMRDSDFAGGEFLSDVYIDNFVFFGNKINASNIPALMVGGPVDITVGGVMMPSGIPSGSTVLSNSLGQIDTELDSDIITTGIVRKGIGDTFIKFTPGQLLEPFRDHSNPAVDGLSLTSSNPSKAFYATGSSVNVVGDGFEQPLWSKTKFEIDLTPSSQHSFYIHSASQNYPMAYWNKDLKKYQGIGAGIGFNTYSGVTLSTLQRLLDEQPLGFGASLDNGAFPIAFRSSSFVIGSPITNFGFPIHPKFHASSSNLISMSDYISEPFLLEKVVLYFSGTLLMNDYFNPSSNIINITTFFILNQRGPFGIDENNSAQVISYYSGSPDGFGNGILSTFTTASTLPSVFNGTYVDTTRDLVTFLQISNPNGDFGTVVQNGLTRDFPGTSGYWSMQIEASSSVKSPVEVPNGLNILISGSAGALPATMAPEYIEKYNFSGRDGLAQTNGRNHINAFASFEKFSSVTTDVNHGGERTFEVSNRVAKSNPYLLLPTDKLIFGWQLPYSQNGFAARNLGTPVYNGKGPELEIGTLGIHKIVFYGSNIKEGKEHHDTLNQLLTSQAIHEVIE